MANGPERFPQGGYADEDAISQKRPRRREVELGREAEDRRCEGKQRQCCEDASAIHDKPWPPENVPCSRGVRRDREDPKARNPPCGRPELCLGWRAWHCLQ